jgi:hypothetical protein
MGKFKKRWFGPFKVQYCLPNNILKKLFLLIILNQIQFWSMLTSWNLRYHYEKKGVLQLALKLKFWITTNTCNSLYLYAMSSNRQLHELQSCNSPYIWCNSLQLNQNNSFSTTIQLHYNQTHNVMLTSLIVIHLLKSNTWHYEDFWTLKKIEISISIVHYEC